MLGNKRIVPRCVLVSLMRGRVSEVAVVEEVLHILQDLTQSRHQRDDKRKGKDLTKHCMHAGSISGSYWTGQAFGRII